MPLYMPLFRACTTTRTLLQIHATLLVSGLTSHALPVTKLIESYAQMGCISTSRLIFDTFPDPDTFMWVVMIKAYTDTLLFKEAIALYLDMQCQHLEMTHYVFPPLLRACSGLRDITMGRKVHGRVTKGGFLGDAFVQTSLVQMYCEGGRLENARRVFDEMPVRDAVSWSSMVSGFIQCGQAEAGLEMVYRTIDEGIKPDSVMMMQAAKACADLGWLEQARAVHGHILRRLAGIDESLENSLITMYCDCGDLDRAEKVFENASCRSVVSWTAMIAGYNQSSCYREALGVFTRMQEFEVEHNAVTMMGILHSCIQLGCIREGRSVHGCLIRRGADPESSSMCTTLIKFYASFAILANCLRVFEVAHDKSLDHWNSLLAAYAQNRSPEKALQLLIRMMEEGLIPDSFTLASSLPACGQIADLCLGTQIHGYTTRSGFQLNRFVQNSLIDMYCKCGSTETAYYVFSELKGKDIVTWNSMISGFSQNGNSEQAIGLFDRMHLEGVEMNQVTFLSVIQACSHLGSLGKGRWIHRNLITSGLKKDARVDTALTVMYAKCGDIEMARRVFDRIPEKSVVSWSSMISGYRSHGLADDAITLFSQMVAVGVRPNGRTFLSVLSACSHAGLVKEGMFYFTMMREDFGIEPELDHCACVIDLLSRAGRTDLAFDLVKSMPVEPDASIWRALLSGYNIHHRKDIVGEIQRQ